MRLDTCQNQISEQLLDTEDAVQEYLDDMEDAENYRDRYIEMCTRVDLKIRETVVPTETEKRSFKLPKIELKKFSGEAKDFLAFWSQFQKIHNDKGGRRQNAIFIAIRGTEIESRTISVDNEECCVSGRTKTDLSALYDELEGKLRSLESLGRTQEKFGDFLTPLVESCLPEEILMAWERKRNTETDAKGSRTLEHLMTFLRLEVQGEEMVQLAKSGFGTPIRKKDSPTERVKPTELMTASALASSEKSSGITDPLLNENTKENFELTDFKNKMKILPDGRYEVKLPWKCNSENLLSNKELTWKRHLRMMNKLRNGKFFEDYKSVFRQWENLNIIERVPEVELNNECHYLPHRPVIKLDSATTKIRPVFDASAREKGKPSLNDCLYKGVNLIELIPDILDRFRIYPVGIVADIEKAFLMLCCTER
ncbi:uncharacterized protein TNCV_1160221 [Trichonephila clavipes]|nr:uncharacterized protein TNCV_1160221 [Trichonephila clavipes]